MHKKIIIEKYIALFEQELVSLVADDEPDRQEKRDGGQVRLYGPHVAGRDGGE